MPKFTRRRRVLCSTVVLRLPFGLLEHGTGGANPTPPYRSQLANECLLKTPCPALNSLLEASWDKMTHYDPHPSSLSA